MQQPDQIIGPLTDLVDGLGKRIATLEETLVQLKSLDLALHEMQFIIYSYVEKIREGLVLIQDEKIMWANKSACAMLGYEFYEVINKSAVELAHPDYRDKLSARFAMIQAGDEIPAGVMWPLITKSREIKYVKPFSYRVIYSGKPALMAFFYDVTEEKKLQDELSLRAEMLDLVTDSVFLMDMKGNIVYVNKAVCQTTGYTLDEIIKMNIVSINTPEFRRRAEIRLKQVSRHKESRFETVHLCKDGTRLTVVVCVKVIKRGGKEFILGIAREVSPEGETKI
jgi:PAS domain S-box-containing protein